MKTLIVYTIEMFSLLMGLGGIVALVITAGALMKAL